MRNRIITYFIIDLLVQLRLSVRLYYSKKYNNIVFTAPYHSLVLINSNILAGVSWKIIIWQKHTLHLQAPAGPCSLVTGHTHYTLSEHLCNGSEGIICKCKELDKKLSENTQNEEEPKKC